MGAEGLVEGMTVTGYDFTGCKVVITLDGVPKDRGLYGPSFRGFASGRMLSLLDAANQLLRRLPKVLIRSTLSFVMLL